MHLKNINCKENLCISYYACISTAGCENLQILSIFVELISHLHVYNMHLGKSALDNSMTSNKEGASFGDFWQNNRQFNEFQGGKNLEFC